MEKCPYCMREMEKPKPLDKRLTSPQYGIYKAVIDAGPEGVDAEMLARVHLPGKSSVTLRTRIHTINKIINPMVLRCNGGRYRLERMSGFHGNFKGEQNEMGGR